MPYRGDLQGFFRKMTMNYDDISQTSQVFEVDDILTLSEDITASERRGLEEKNGFLDK